MESLNWKKAEILDLISVSILAVFIWNMNIGGTILPLSIVLLRLIAGFSLTANKRCSWLPISIFNLWVIISLLVPNHLHETIICQSSFHLVKTGLLMLGDFKLDTIDNYAALVAASNCHVEVWITFVFTVLYWGWLFLYPIVRYLLIWRQKEFRQTAFFKEHSTMIVLYLIAVVCLSILFSASMRFSASGMINIWIFLLAIFPVFYFYKTPRNITPPIRHYFVFATLFFVAYTIGRETEHILSLLGILIIPHLFYLYLCKLKKIPMSQRDGMLLLAICIIFWQSQFSTGILRIAMLLTGIILAAIQSRIFYKQYNSKSNALVLFLSLAFILPILNLGYNPFAVTHARRVSKFDVYQYAYNGILKTTDGEHVGLRDRYTEILPCLYDEIQLAGNPNEPYLKVKEDGFWGLYDLESQKMLVKPQYKAIYPYNQGFFKLIDLVDCVTYYNKASMQNYTENGSSVNGIVNLPYHELSDKNYHPIRLNLTNAPMEHEKIVHTLKDFILSTYGAENASEPYSEFYWEWAEKSSSLIEKIGKDCQIFTLNTSTKSQQAIDKIIQMFDDNGRDTQLSSNNYSAVLSTLNFYLTIDENRTLVNYFSDLPQLWNMAKTEYDLWLDFYSNYNKFYSDFILAREPYSALPLSLNEWKIKHSDYRRNWLKQEHLLFVDNKPIENATNDVNIEHLRNRLLALYKTTQNKSLLESLLPSLKKWMLHRENFATLLSPQVKESYQNQTKNIKALLYSNIDNILEEHHF